MELSVSQARAVYDRIGSAQDRQSFYEDPTVDRLLAHAGVGDGAAVFELGCGTGRLAERLLDGPSRDVAYLGVDVSPVMADLAAAKVAAWPDRARAMLVDGSLPLPAGTGSADCVISTFVFDLLEEVYARGVLEDLRRILAPGGRLCLAGLAPGVSRPERFVSRAWTNLWRVAPQLVGGCRPTRLKDLLGAAWQVQHRSPVHRWGLVTEVVVATPVTPPP